MVPCKTHNIFSTNIHCYCSGGKYILNKYTFLLLKPQSLSNLSYSFSSHRIHNLSMVKINYFAVRHILFFQVVIYCTSI